MKKNQINRLNRPDKSDLTEMFKEMGYRYSWDFSKSDGQHWHEFIDPVSEKLTIQIGFGISKEAFLKWFGGEDLPLFIAGKEKSKEWSRLCTKIKDKYNIEWQ